MTLKTSLARVILLGGLAAISIAGTTASAAATAGPATTQQASTPPATTHQVTTHQVTTQQDWTLLESPPPTDALLIGSTCVDAGDCWSVGGTIGNGNNNNTFRGVAEHWNGSAWSTVPTLRPGSDGWLFTSVTCAGADDCWAVGANLDQGSPPAPFIEHWNGTAWSIVTISSVAGYLLGVTCESSSACWAVGPRTGGNGNANTVGILLERWNGSSWALVASPATGQKYSDLDSVTCPSPSECFAVGWDGPNPQNTGFLPVFPAEANGKSLIERWNGSSWQAIASPQVPGGSYLSGVTCVGPSDCWAVGSLTNTAGFAKSALVDHWNGTSWTSSGVSGFEIPTGDFLHEVTCLNASYCLAAGSSGLESGFTQGIEPAVAVWNGTKWSGTSVTGSYVIGTLDGIACAGRARCFASGFAVNPNNNNVGITTLMEQLVLPQGYRLAAADGGVFDFGNDAFHGSMAGKMLNAPVVAMASPDADGYQLVGSDGGVFSFGDASYQGSMAGKHLNAPAVGIAARGDWGYWLAASDGGVFSFGNAGFDGSMAGKNLAAPIVGIAATPDGDGYWLVGSDGGVFSFGDAGYHGSMAGKGLAAPIVGIAATPDGDGYWLVGSDGGVFSFGDATYYDSMSGRELAAPIAGMAAAPDGKGYWLVGADGGVFAFGDAAFVGSEAGKGIALPVVADS